MSSDGPSSGKDTGNKSQSSGNTGRPGTIIIKPVTGRNPATGTTTAPSTGAQGSDQPAERSGESQQGDNEESNGDGAATEIVNRCEALVEDFRSGANASKSNVLAQISRALAEFFSSREGDTDDEYNEAFDVYVEMLDSHEREQREALREGQDQIRARDRNEEVEGGRRRRRADSFFEDADGELGNNAGDIEERGRDSNDGESGPSKRAR